MIRWFGQVWRDRLVRSIAVLLGGAAGAKLIALAFVPLITRFYSPEAFGVFGAFNAIVSMALPLISLSLPMAIVLPRADDEALALVRLAALTAVIMAIAALAASVLARVPLRAALGEEQAGWLIYLLAPALLLNVAVAIVTRWAQRKRLFALIARAGALQSLVQHAVMAGWGAIAASGPALVLIAMAASAVEFGYSLLGVLRHRRQEDAAPATGSKAPAREWRLADLLRAYSDFPMYRTPQILVSAMSHAMLVPVVAYGYGPAAAGFVTLARIVLQVPGQIIGIAVSTAFYQHFNEAIQKGRSCRLVLIRTTGWLALVTLPIFGGIAFIGPLVLELVFGPGWELTGVFMQWLALWHGIQLAGTAAIVAIPALRLQNLALLAEIAALGILGGILAGAIALEIPVQTAVAALSVAGLLTGLFPIAIALHGAWRADRALA